jgi:hypothetical protein
MEWPVKAASEFSSGDSPRDVHRFGYFGSEVWAEDAFGFLNQYCTK